MWRQLKTRQSMVGAVLALYLLPMVLTIAYSLAIVPLHVSWSLFTVGLLLSIAGTLIFLFLLLGWDSARPRPLPVAMPEPAPPQPAVPLIEEKNDEQLAHLEEEIAELRTTHAQLLEEITYRNEELQKLAQERDLHQREARKIEETYDHYRATAEDILEKEKLRCHEMEETISELRVSCEERQKQVEQLENKIHDLTYEIKTLLQIADIGDKAQSPAESGNVLHETPAKYNILPDEEEITAQSESHIHDAAEAAALLKRCINIAQKITSSHHLNSPTSRFRDLALDNYALDLRRLCDSLSSEISGTVFVWSPKEGKLLFINDQIKNILGWSPTKFMQDFPHIVQEGMHEWKNSIANLSVMNLANARLVMKSRSGQDMLLQCDMGMIPTGVFRNNVVGVLYNSK